MDQAVLVDSQVLDSVKLIKKLDSAGDPPSFAVWYYYTDTDEWRLILAGKTFDPLLLKHEPVAYRKVVDAMADSHGFGITVSQIRLIRSDDVLPKAIAMLCATGPATIVRVRFTNGTLNGIFIKDVVVLRCAINTSTSISTAP